MYPGRPETELRLAPLSIGHGEETTAAIRELVTSGGGNGMIFSVDDSHQIYEELLAKGVEFTQAPTEHFCGIDSGLRDPFGIRCGSPSRLCHPSTFRPLSSSLP